MEKKVYQKWQIRKLVSWFVLFVVIGGVYLSTTVASMYADKTAEDSYWEAALYNAGAESENFAALSEHATPVTTGTYIECLKELNLKGCYFRLVCKVWFKWQGDEDLDMIHNFHVYNGTVNKMEVQEDYVRDGWHYQLASLDVSVFKNYWTRRFPLESHQLRFYIEPDYTVNRVVLIPDTENSGANYNLSVAGYYTTRLAHSIYTMEYDTTFGQVGFSSGQTTSEYMTQLELNRDGYGVYAKCFIALLGTSLWVFITMFLCTYHRVDPLSMIPAALFGTVSNIMVGANLLPDALDIGLLEYVNVWGILTILGGAIVIININRIRSRYNDNKFAALYGRVMSFTMVGIVLLGHILLPISAYIWE